jgi:hypothetical protein
VTRLLLFLICLRHLPLDLRALCVSASHILCQTVVHFVTFSSLTKVPNLPLFFVFLIRLLRSTHHPLTMDQVLLIVVLVAFFYGVAVYFARSLGVQQPGRDFWLPFLVAVLLFVSLWYIFPISEHQVSYKQFFVLQVHLLHACGDYIRSAKSLRALHRPCRPRALQVVAFATKFLLCSTRHSVALGPFERWIVASPRVTTSSSLRKPLLSPFCSRIRDQNGFLFR